MSNTTQTIDEQTEAQFSELLSNAYRPPNEMVDSQPFVLYPNYVEVKLGGISKAISLLDFKSVIDGLLQTDQRMVQISLPFNCFSFAKSSTDISLSCYYPEKVTEITHLDRSTNKEKKYKLPFPNLIISTKLKLIDGFWVVQGTKYFITNKKVTQLPEDSVVWNHNYANGIWSVPFPNFYAEGNMCYGRNTMPSKFNNNLRGLDYYYQVIFASAFNDDLGINAVKTHTSPANWFKKLSALTSFPYDELK